MLIVTGHHWSKMSRFKFTLKNSSAIDEMKMHKQAVLGIRTSRPEATLAKPRSGARFDTDVDVDGHIPKPKTAPHDCGDAIGEILWWCVDVHQVHQETEFVSDSVFDKQPM